MNGLTFQSPHLCSEGKWHLPPNFSEGRDEESASAQPTSPVRRKAGGGAVGVAQHCSSPPLLEGSEKESPPTVGSGATLKVTCANSEEARS